DRGEALALGDRVAVMMGGRLLQVDETAQVFRAPASEDVARFVGVETIVDASVQGREGSLTMVQVGCALVAVAAPANPGERVRLCVRAEDVSVTSGAVRPPAAGNHLAGRLVSLSPAGPHLRLLIDC